MKPSALEVPAGAFVLLWILPFLALPACGDPRVVPEETNVVVTVEGDSESEGASAAELALLELERVRSEQRIRESIEALAAVIAEDAIAPDTDPEAGAGAPVGLAVPEGPETVAVGVPASEAAIAAPETPAVAQASYDPGPVPAALAPPPPVPLAPFYEELLNWGEWFEVDPYGPIWRPFEAADPAWRPYTVGEWVESDLGWTWASGEHFGSIVYHYGRWLLLEDFGWAWVPGNEWAPAWVAWRSGDAYVGWAPLPPEAVWDDAVGIGGWVDASCHLGPDAYAFVPVADFGVYDYSSVYVESRFNIGIYVETINVTRCERRRFHGGGGGIVCGGPWDRHRDHRPAHHRVPRVDLVDARDRHDDRLRYRPGGGKLAVRRQLPSARGTRRTATPELPRLEKAVATRGWSESHPPKERLAARKRMLSDAVVALDAGSPERARRESESVPIDSVRPIPGGEPDSSRAAGFSRKAAVIADATAGSTAVGPPVPDGRTIATARRAVPVGSSEAGVGRPAPGDAAPRLAATARADRGGEPVGTLAPRPRAVAPTDAITASRRSPRTVAVDERLPAETVRPPKAAAASVSTPSPPTPSGQPASNARSEGPGRSNPAERATEPRAAAGNTTSAARLQAAARQKAELDARRQREAAQSAARQKAELDARRQREAAQSAARQKAELDARRQREAAQAAARQKAELDARRQREAAQAAARQKAEADARRQREAAQSAARQKAEFDARRQREAAQSAARQKAEADARRRAAESARRQKSSGSSGSRSRPSKSR